MTETGALGALSPSHLFAAEARRNFLLVVRYPMEFAAAILLLAAMFFGLLYGARFLGIASMSTQPDAAVLGYGCWLLMTCGFNNMTAEVTAEANSGTLTNIFQAAHSPLAILSARSLVASVVSLVIAGIVVTLMAAGTGVHLHFSAWALVSVATLLGSAVGVGLMAAGVTVVLKRVALLLLPVQFLLIAMTMTAFEDMPADVYAASLFLPAVPSLVSLRSMLLHGEPPDWLVLAGLANTVVYLVVGTLVFHALAMSARRRGTISEY